MTKSKRFTFDNEPVAVVAPWQPSYASLLVAGSVIGGTVVALATMLPWQAWFAYAQFQFALAGF